MPRDRSNGRYRHVPCYLTFDEEKQVEVGGCDACPKIWLYGGGSEPREFKDVEAAHRAGAISEHTYIFLTTGS